MSRDILIKNLLEKEPGDAKKSHARPDVKIMKELKDALKATGKWDDKCNAILARGGDKWLKKFLAEREVNPFL